jgi:hypothetical protein
VDVLDYWTVSVGRSRRIQLMDSLLAGINVDEAISTHFLDLFIDTR